MKKQDTLRFQLPKGRMHRALFDQDLPFRHRVEKSPKAYQRKPKHPNKGDQDAI